MPNLVEMFAAAVLVVMMLAIIGLSKGGVSAGDGKVTAIECPGSEA